MQDSPASNSTTTTDKLWGTALVITILLFAVLIGVHFVELTSLARWWGTTSKYGHSLLIFPVILYLIYEKKEELRHLTPNPAPGVLVLLALSAIALSLFSLIDIQILTETIIVIMFPLVLWSILGSKITWVISIPLLLLLTTVPMWELFAPLLTEVTATVAHRSLNILNVPVLREGDFLTIPEGIFEIAEGCGGFRYFIVGLSIGLIYAYLTFHTLKSRLLAIGIAIALSIVTNWIRVMIVIWAGHVTNMQHPYVQAHVNLGWYVFGAAFFLYFIILNRFAAKPVKDLPAKTESTISTAATIKPKKLISTGIAALSVIVLTPAIINPAALQGDTSNHPNIAQLDEIEGWSGPYPYSGQWAPAFNGAHGEKQVTFIKDGQAINVYIAYYLKQDQEQELINYDNKVINNNWMPYKYNSLKIDTTRNNTLRVQEIKSRSPQGSQVVWSWYYIAGSETADRRLAKFLELKKLVNNNKLSAIIAVSPDSGSDYPTARNAAEELLSSLHPQILTVFEGI